MGFFAGLASGVCSSAGAVFSPVPGRALFSKAGICFSTAAWKAAGTAPLYGTVSRFSNAVSATATGSGNALFSLRVNSDSFNPHRQLPRSSPLHGIYVACETAAAFRCRLV